MVKKNKKIGAFDSLKQFLQCSTAGGREPEILYQYLYFKQTS
jgi:hypothetical protein